MRKTDDLMTSGVDRVGRAAWKALTDARCGLADPAGCGIHTAKPQVYAHLPLRPATSHARNHGPRPAASRAMIAGFVIAMPDLAAYGEEV
jgi:hypothetical protein